MRLRVVHGEEPPSGRPNEQYSNWIIFKDDGTTDMVINHFKTSSFRIPPPVSEDTMFQLELSSLESVEEIPIVEGVDVAKCSWDETTSADFCIEIVLKISN